MLELIQADLDRSNAKYAQVEQVKKFVYVVGPDNKVAQKVVTLGPLVGDLRVIRDGITAEDKVVVNGLMRVRPGVVVNPQMADAAPAAAAPAAAAAK